MGHVDHGKSSILDKIRGTAIVKAEAGNITQAIGASIIPLKVIEKAAGHLLKAMGTDFTIPGLLFIDTPGHAAFTNLRRRGGNLADIAILVVDINEGPKPQTLEAIDILKQYKTPFIVAANKIDIIGGWKAADPMILKNIEKQSDGVKTILDTKLYELVGKFSELGFESERFDRVDDFQKQVAIIPCSAKSGEGIPEVLAVMAGLAQKYLEESLSYKTEGPAIGTVLEVKKEKGLGTTLDVIIYDGTLRVGDTLVIGGINEPIVTKVKALLEPAQLAEMRDKKAKFIPVKEVVAATGVKISALNIEEAVAGMPLRVAVNNVEKAKEDVQNEVGEVMLETQKEGVVVKADSLGGLEALTLLLKEKNIPVRTAAIGDVTRKDIADAQSSKEKNPLLSAVLGFSVKDTLTKDDKKDVEVITADVIYAIIDRFELWQESVKKRMESKELDTINRPCKIELMNGYVFRQSNPAIVGVSVVSGTLKTGMPMMKDGKAITTVKGIQHEKENKTEAKKGMQVAASLDKVMVGRQIAEGDFLYSALTENEFRILKKLKQYLDQDEIEVVREIANIMRKNDTMWGV